MGHGNPTAMNNPWDPNAPPVYPPMSVSFTTHQHLSAAVPPAPPSAPPPPLLPPARLPAPPPPAAPPLSPPARPVRFYTDQMHVPPCAPIGEVENHYPYVTIAGAPTQLSQSPGPSGTAVWINRFGWPHAPLPSYSNHSVCVPENTILQDAFASSWNYQIQTQRQMTKRRKEAIILVHRERVRCNKSVQVRYTETRERTRKCSFPSKNIEIITLNGSSNVLIVKVLAPKVNRHKSREEKLAENDVDTVKKVEQAIDILREALPFLPKGRKMLILLNKRRTELQHALEGSDHLKQALRQCLGIVDRSVNPLDYCVCADGHLKRRSSFDINDDDLRHLLQCCKQDTSPDSTVTTHEQEQKLPKSKSKPSKRSSKVVESATPAPEMDLAIVKGKLQEQVKVWYPKVLEQSYVPSVTCVTVDRTEQDGGSGSDCHEHLTSTAKDNLGAMKLLSAKLGEGQTANPDWQESDRRDEQTQQLVLRCLLHVCTKQKEVMFVLSQVNYRTYLNEPAYLDTVAGLPRPVGLKHLNMHRGDFDILIIHRQRGLLVGEVKSIGNNFDSISLTEEEQDRMVVKRIQQSLKQLTKAVQVLRHLMSDLLVLPRVIKTVMLPCISARQLHRVLDDSTQVRRDLCECLELDDVDDPSGLCLTSDDVMNPYQWWHRRMTESGDDQAMTAEVYLDLVSRFAGPATTAQPCYQPATDFEHECSPEPVSMQEETA